MEEADKTRTYLILDEGNIYNENENFRILGYFSLANKSLSVKDNSNISKTKIQELDGISKKAEIIDCYLIGQLGKNDYYKNEIDGKTILDSAVDILEKVKSFIGKRVILVEAVDDEKVMQFYINNGFTKVSEYIPPFSSEKLHQLVRRI